MNDLKGTGRSTRLADGYIQHFFKLENNEEMTIIDHDDTAESNLRLTKKIADRISGEHPSENFIIKENEIIRIIFH